MSGGMPFALVIFGSVLVIRNAVSILCQRFGCTAKPSGYVIEHASFHNRHNIFRCRRASPVVAEFAKGDEAYHWT
jgi:hypothetical protein